MNCTNVFLLVVTIGVLAGCSKSTPNPPIQSQTATTVTAPQQAKVVENKPSEPPAKEARAEQPNAIDVDQVKAKAKLFRDRMTESERRSRVARSGLVELSSSELEWIKKLGDDLAAGNKLTWPEAKLYLRAMTESMPRLDEYVVSRANELNGLSLLQAGGDDFLDIETLYRFVMLEDADFERLKTALSSRSIEIENSQFLFQHRLGKKLLAAFVHQRFKNRDGATILKGLNENPDNGVLQERFALLSNEEQDELATVSAVVTQGESLPWNHAKVLLRHSIGVDLTDDAVLKRIDRIGHPAVVKMYEDRIDGFRTFVKLSKADQLEAARIVTKTTGVRIRIQAVGFDDP